jgi:hypothetical protein
LVTIPKILNPNIETEFKQNLTVTRISGYQVVPACRQAGVSEYQGIRLDNLLVFDLS